MTLPGNNLPRMLTLAAWRYMRLHRWQSWLSFLGIMLGVMMVVAVDLASSSARRAFALSVESVSGTLTHQIVGTADAVPDAVFAALRTELGIRRSAPSISADVRVQGRSFTLVGLDLISEASLQRRRPGFEQNSQQLTALALAALNTPEAVLMPASAAAELGLRKDAEFTLDPPYAGRSLSLAGLIDGEAAGAALIFADIALVQELLGRQGSIDSIDLILDAEEVSQIKAWLPPSLGLVEASTRSDTLEQMTGAFHVNLLAMSLLALLVAALLIYNTVSLSVLERRSSFGVLRSLGCTKAQIGKLILLENTALGLAASAAGCGAGLLLGSFLVKLVTRTIDDLYFNLNVTQFLIDPLVLLKGFVWGTGITVLAAALPAWQAGRTLPITLQHKGSEGAELQRRLPLLSAGGCILLLAGSLLLFAHQGLVSGFVALNFLIFGFCLLVPQILQLVLSSALQLGARRLNFAWRLALRSIQSGLDRTALAVAALTVAVSVTVGVGIMVGSFRDTVILWLDQTLPGDVQLTRFDSNAGLSQELENRLATFAGVARISRGYNENAESSLGPLRVHADSAAVQDWLYMKAGAEGAGENSVLISEPMAWLLHLQIGDSFMLYTAAGEQRLEVSGIFYDYSTGNPLIALTEVQLLRYWPASAANRLTLHLQPDAGSTSLISAIRSLLSEQTGNFGVVANSDIKRITLAIFDRTFAITHVLRLLALVVAFVGVLSAMLALQLQRMRDYAVLRASGMTVKEVALLICAQTLIMGLCAGLLALPLGLLMSEVLIDVINQRSFGWSMQHSLPSSVLLQAVLLAIVAAVLAGLYPARRVAAVQTALALREE